MGVPRFWSGEGALQSTDLASGAAVGAIVQGGLAPDKIGQTVINKSGSNIAAGKLVYVNGWDNTSQLPTIALASAAGQVSAADYITTAAINNNASGTAALHYSLTAQNTNAANVGDAVYLDTVAGGYTMTSPPGAGIIYQLLGRVAVKSATVGVVDFNILAGTPPVLVEILQVPFSPVIATTATTESPTIRVPYPGTILGIQLCFNSALAINGTNYITFSANNRTQTKLLTQAVVGNSTNTGGTAITQYGAYVLTLTATAADLVVAGGDKISASGVVTGTLGGTLQGIATFAIQPS